MNRAFVYKRTPMRHVIFYSPHFGANTLQFVRPLKDLEDINLIGLGHDQPDYIGELGIFNEFFQVKNATNQAELEKTLAKIGKGRQIHRLLNIQEQLQLLIARLREKFGIPGLYPEIVAPFRDKALMKKVLKQKKIRCADYEKGESEGAARAFVEKNGYPIVMKPLKGAGCEDTFFVYNNIELEKALSQVHLTPETPAILEEFINGQEGSFETFTINGKVVFHAITTYYPPILDSMRNSWIQPIYFFQKDADENLEFKEVIQVGKKVIKALNPGTSITHMEWFRNSTDGRIYVGEIAARPPGFPVIPLHDFGHDIDLHTEWGKVMVNDRFDLKPTRNHFVSCSCLRAQGSGTHITGFDGIEGIRESLGPLICALDLPGIGSKKTESYIGEGAVFCRGDDRDRVLEAAQYVTEHARIHC